MSLCLSNCRLIQLAGDQLFFLALLGVNRESPRALWECGNRAVCDFQALWMAVEKREGELPIPLLRAERFPRPSTTRHFHSAHAPTATARCRHWMIRCRLNACGSHLHGTYPQILLQSRICMSPCGRVGFTTPATSRGISRWSRGLMLRRSLD